MGKRNQILNSFDFCFSVNSFNICSDILKYENFMEEDIVVYSYDEGGIHFSTPINKNVEEIVYNVIQKVV